MDLGGVEERLFLAPMAFPTWLGGQEGGLVLLSVYGPLSTGLEMALSTTCLQPSSCMPIKASLWLPGEVCGSIPRDGRAQWCEAE